MKRIETSALRASMTERLSGHASVARIGGAVAAAAIVALIAGTAGLWSNSTTLEQVTSNARSLHAANATAGAAGIARIAVAQAIVFEADQQIGVVTEDDAAAALAEAREALVVYTETITTPTPESTSFGASVRDVLSEVERGAVRSANELRSTEMQPAYERLLEQLTERQVNAEEAIFATETAAGRTARVTQVFILLAIPGGSMLAYWFVVRRKVLQRELEMGTRLEAERSISRAKDDLIAGISHELRTPLTGIHGFSEILMTQGLADQEMALDLVTIIHSESAELGRMIDDLLTAARIDAEELEVAIEPTELSAAIEAVVAPVVRQGREISVNCPDVWVSADPLRLRQVLRNLVSNAAKHGGGNIAVLVAQRDGMAEITVADDGPGVSEEIISRLFDRFVNGGRGALLAGSVGLGLAVARDLVDRMGGSVHYKRIDDITMFEVSVPLMEPAALEQLAST